MNFRRNSQRIALSIGWAIFGSSLNIASAAAPILSYQGINLGMDEVTARNIAATKFAYIGETSVDSLTSTMIGSDANGKSRSVCPIAAPLDLRVNCLKVRFVFWNGESGRRLSYINVKQSVVPSVPYGDLVGKLRAAYGAPRKEYAGADVRSEPFEQGRNELAFVWNGTRIPLSPFRPGTPYPAADYEKIGGSYVTASVHLIDGRAVGYELNIVDSERNKAAMKAWHVEQENKTNNAIKF